METLFVKPADNRYTVRERLQRMSGDQILIVLTWDIVSGWTNTLDFEVIQREARANRYHVAWAIEDPERRPPARKLGFTVFPDTASARSYLAEHGQFPTLKEPKSPRRPRRPWWAPALHRPKWLQLKRRRWWLVLLEVVLLLAVLAGLAGAAFMLVPHATIVLHPAGVKLSKIALVTIDPALTAVDLEHGVIPSQRIGDEFEGVAEVATSGRGVSFAGRAVGSVVLTNLLGQDYRVPQGTTVRTSSGSYPVRFVTKSEVTVPPFGQVEVQVEALEEGPAGNVDAYQINLVEGVVGFAIRVTNPNPIGGAESKAVAVVSESDQTRAWDLAAQQAMAQAANGLQELAAQEPGRFLPQQSFVIQAAPKTAYTHLVGEQTDKLGVALRLLVTGQAVYVNDVQAVALHQLSTQLPEGYTLRDARFEYGEAAEEDLGPGAFSFFVTVYGYATANDNLEALKEAVRGVRVEQAPEILSQSIALDQAPEITVTPDWFPFIPRLVERISMSVEIGSLGE